MKTIHKPINACTIQEIVSMIAYKAQLTHHNEDISAFSLLVKAEADNFCFIHNENPHYVNYDSDKGNYPLHAAVSYMEPIKAVSYIAKKLLKLIPLHKDPELGQDVLLLKVIFSSTHQKFTLQFNNESMETFSACNILNLQY